MSDYSNRHHSFLKWGLGLTLALLVGAVLFTLPQTARAWYRELVLVWTSPVAESIRSVKWGDFDNDGDLDLLTGGPTIRVYENDGGTFTQVWMSSIGASSVDWGDWDGDGDLDIGAGRDTFNHVFVNTGTGFSVAWLSPESETSTSIAWGDLNGDGLADLAVGNGSDAPNRVYTSTGTSLVLAWTAPVTQSTTSVALADYDLDGDLDLAVGNTGISELGEANLIYRNDGGMLNPSPVWISPEEEDTCGLAWGDFDGNGYPDLAVANGCNAYWSYEQQRDRVYANAGGSLSSAWTSPEIMDSNCTAWGDWDGDGDLDLFVGNEEQRIAGFVYQNGGNGAFILAQTISADRSPEWPSGQQYIDGADWGDYDGDGDDDLVIDSMLEDDTEHVLVYASGGGGLGSAWSADDQTTDDTHAVAWGDWDSDGRLDLAVGNDGNPLRIYTYNGGTPSLAWSSTLTDPVRSLAWGDWDGDGDLDLAVGSDGAPNRVYQNDGGSLSVAWSAPVISATQSVAWGDWDEDGDLDLAVGNANEPNQIYENDGGTLSPAWTSTEADATHSVAWGDWDGDDDLDLGVGNDGAANRVYQNGAGSLTLAWSAPVVSATHSVAWGDCDGDGAVDLAVGNEAEPNQVYTNTGGGLALAWTSPEADVTHQVAWGDWDGDGDLDLAAGNGGNPNRIYANTGTTLSAAWASPESDHTRSLAWGDWDGDGDLDLAAGNGGNPNRIYANTGTTLSAAWASPESDHTRSLAWGDWDGDGDLDLAAGNWFNAVRVYDNGSARMALAWSSVERDATMDTAWGDWDGDGDLDLAVANYEEPNRVYENVNGLLEPAWTSDEWDPSTSLAWGDWDGDGDLDLVVGNGIDDNDPALQHPNRVYENTGGALALAWTSPETDRTMDVAWGDWDGDGDLDLAVGNWPVYDGGYLDGENRVYENAGGTLALAWTGPEGADRTSSIAWADWDGDGDLDLAVGNGGSADEGTYSQPNRVYRNDGNGLTLAWTSPAAEPTTSIAWGDWDLDGDPDLAVGEGEQYDHVYLNTGGALTLTWTSMVSNDDTRDVAWGDWDNDGDPDLLFANTRVHEYAEYGVPRPDYLHANTGGSLTLWQSLPDRAYSEAVEWADYDGDGDLDLAIGNGGLNYALLDPVPFNRPNWIYQNHTADVQALPDTPTHVRLVTPGSDRAGLFHSATILQGPAVTITYSLVDPESDPIHYVEAYYSVDGGAHWQPAVAAAGTLTTGLAASPAGTEHIFIWDIYASGFQGASDNTVFRIDAYQGLTGSGPFLTPFRTVRSGPFRLRGSQVRVMSGTLPVENGIVYRLPAGSSGDFEPYRDLGGRILRTGPSGYLEGWGQIALGDRLVALAPVTATESYGLYYTNAAPTLTGVEPYTVTALGVQTLVVTEANPLVLLTLDVSLEWDARQDTKFLSELDYNLRRASELLYDWTDGQVALGETTIYHDRQHWLDAHVRIYATNRMRPNASQGGITSGVITDPVTSTITYAPGQVHIGAVWNRYGDPSGTLGEDWPRTLAHELGHFALFLDDNYLGFSESGLLIPVDTCDGSAMSDPYRDDFSEFLPESDWLPDCERTLSHQTTGRADWQTIATFYPWLDPAANAGPSGLPLAVTELTVVEPVTPTTALDAPYFYLSQDGHSVQPGLSARAFLFQEDRVTDLGRPVLDHVLARGASPGDRVCVYEPDAERAGCETISAGDEQLVLFDQPGWLPDVIVSPVSSRTVVISVTNVPTDVPFRARLYPLNDPASAPITLTLTGGVLSGTFHTEQPALDGYLHVYVDEGAPRREIVTDFSIGGNPARLRGRWARLRGRWARLRGRWAPGVSADGQVILFGDLNFEAGEFFTLQAATRIPDPLPWATLVGHAYRLSASPNAPDLTAGSLSFMYAGSEVPAGGERFLRLYFWDGVEWHILPTELDTEQNTASCAAQGPGLYALMSSIEIPLYGPGWNMVAYPVDATRPVTEALLSISGYYTTVYGYDAENGAWRMYDVHADPYANDLAVLEYGRGYWINVTQAITLYLGGATQGDARIDKTLALQSPPSTFYGPVRSGGDFTPAAGMPVRGMVNGVACAEGQTLLYEGEVVYALHVLADGPGGAAGCGGPGDEVVFEVDGQTMGPRPVWDNDRVRYLPLEPEVGAGHEIYLPLVMRN
jgi:hypothetical protein